MPSHFLKPGDYRFEFGLKRGSLDFFRNVEPEVVREERIELLQSGAEHYIAATENSVTAVRETAEFLAEFVGTQAPPPTSSDAQALLHHIGCTWEGDFVILDEELCVQAGCVCFPSSWSLPEKLGQRIEVVHAPVPGLNDELSEKIRTFLSRLKPGDVWERWNWGLAASEILNYHPHLQLPRLDETATLDTTWFRAEQQALVRLPRTNAILFGIRITVSSLSEEAAASETFATVFKEQLRTMPAVMAEYKGLTRCREALIGQL